jgi:ankyrin repeat protein
MSGTEREAMRWRGLVAGFLLPAALTALPALHPHPALGAGPLLALPLFLLAVVRAAGYGEGAGMRARLWPALGLCLVGCLAGAVLLGVPAWHLQRTGSLGAVLLLSTAAAAWVWLLWWRWPAPALVFFAEDEAQARPGRSMRATLALARQLLGDGEGGGMRGLLAALALAAMFALALALALPLPWPEPIWRLFAIVLQAVLVAPLAAWAVVELTARQLLAEPDAGPAAAPSMVADRDAGLAAPLPDLAPAGNVQEQLYVAARAGRVDDALAAIQAGADPAALPDPAARDQRALPVLAALLADLRLLRALIGAGLDLNRRHAGLTPLLAATRDSWHGRPEAVMTLLANGADPRLADGEGRTPLHGAALSVDPAVAALLLDAGAPLDAVDREGWSPLGVACANGNWRMAKFLLERGARTEPDGGQPVLLAAAGGEDDAAGVRLLLKFKARVDARGRLNRSALHVACLAAHAEVAQALLDAGADVNARDEQGVSPLLEAARAGHLPTLKVLAARHPDAAVCDNAGRNALAIACQASRSDGELVEALLALGVDPQQACRDGRRALDYAVAAGRWSLVARLDPHYPLPACVADAAEELADVPPLMRLRVALQARRHDHVRELLPLLAPQHEALSDLLVEVAAQVDPVALRLLLPACAGDAPAAAADALLWRLFAQGPAADTAIRALLERGAQPGGRGGLARFLAAAPGVQAASGELLALELLARGADAFGGADDGAPPLLLAIRRDWPRLVSALLAHGVDPEARDVRGVTPLLLACTLGQEDAVRQLVAHGAQPGTRAADGQTALGLALASGRREIARWLDWPRFPLPRRPLRAADLPAAAQQGDADAVLRLLDLGLPLDAVDAQGCTALLRASGGGHLPIVQALLERGADPAHAARSGATSLSAALSMRHDAVVQALLERGAAPDQALPGGITPLMVAAALGHAKGVQLLLAHGADARARDEEAGTALHALARFGFGARERGAALALWDALLAGGADADAADASGQTPLLLLLGARVEPGARCDEELLLAQVERLLARGVSLGAQDRRGFGPLHLAALHGLARAVRVLLAAGADPDLRDAINRRPPEIALMRGFVDIAAEFQPPKPAPSIARFLRPG